MRSPGLEKLSEGGDAISRRNWNRNAVSDGVGGFSEFLDPSTEYMVSTSAALPSHWPATAPAQFFSEERALRSRLMQELVSFRDQPGFRIQLHAALDEPLALPGVAVA